VGYMWPATAFPLACGSIKEKSSKFNLLKIL